MGVSAYDALSRSLFALRAYVITTFGDIPAVSIARAHEGTQHPASLSNVQDIGSLTPPSPSPPTPKADLVEEGEARAHVNRAGPDPSLRRRMGSSSRPS